jgi:CheY-like chemotaxis protein
VKKLKSILLVDDDIATNYLHRMVIESYGFTEHIAEVHDGQEAMEYLTKKIDGEYPRPEIIFLDINMPRMDGWEFLEAYENIDPECKAGAVIAMLTTSLNPDDRSKASDYDCVKNFENKPLDHDKLSKLLADVFPECVKDS